MKYILCHDCSPRLLCLILLSLLLPLAGCASTSESGSGPAIQTIAFASCARANQPQDIWQSILETQPDLFLFIGDNVYVDQQRPPKGVEDFEHAYATLDAQPGWKALCERVPVLATWDDHDYGLNDAGIEFPLKAMAQQQFIKFFDLPVDSPVRQREGVYDAHCFGPTGQRVQIILLDTRTFRDPIARNPQRPGHRLGPYIARTDGQGSMLGQAQWVWLEEQLRQTADVRIIASSIQVVADEYGWETWGNLPHERRRLYDLIEATRASGVFFISGDMHHTEASLDARRDTPYPVWDFTSSGMSESDRPIIEPNSHRVGKGVHRANFGLIQIDWYGDTPGIVYQSRGRDGAVLLEHAVPLSDLKPAAQR